MAVTAARSMGPGRSVSRCGSLPRAIAAHLHPLDGGEGPTAKRATESNPEIDTQEARVPKLEWPGDVRHIATMDPSDYGADRGADGRAAASASLACSFCSQAQAVSTMNVRSS
jgi:hypothetical protein